MEEYMGIIKLFAGNFAPQYYMFCHGQTLSIAQYTALFSIIGTTYGGDGRTTFKLPDLRSRVPVGAGQSPSLPYISAGEAGASSVPTAAQGQPTSQVQPYLGLNYIICVMGIFPPRS